MKQINLIALGFVFASQAFAASESITTCKATYSYYAYKRDLVIVYRYKEVRSDFANNPLYRGTMDIKISAGDKTKNFPLNYRAMIDVKGIPFNTVGDGGNLKLKGPWALLKNSGSSRFVIYGLGRSLDYWHQEENGEILTTASFRNSDKGSCQTIDAP